MKPLAALFQATSQASKLGLMGRAKMWPRRISSMDLSEVTTITYNGIANSTAKATRIKNTTVLETGFLVGILFGKAMTL